MIDINEWCRGPVIYHDAEGKEQTGPVLFVRRLKELSISDEEIAKILNILDETCQECWDTDTSRSHCYCNADE